MSGCSQQNRSALHAETEADSAGATLWPLSGKGNLCVRTGWLGASPVERHGLGGQGAMEAR